MSGEYDSVIVTVEDMMAVSYCARGSKAFARRYGLDMHSFIKNGIPANELLALNDAMAVKAVEAAAKRMGVKDGR